MPPSDLTGTADQAAARIEARMPVRMAAILRALPALLPALFFLPLLLSPPFNHDVAAVLQFSERWLNGETLYSRLIDVNPPLIFLLSLPPAWIAAHSPISAPLALRMCVLGFGMLAWRLSWRARDRAAEPPVERALLDALPLFLLLGAGYDFAQREHLMVVAALPYLLGAARRAEGQMPRGRIASALLAGLFFSLKPHFLAIPALAELFVLLRRGPRAALADPTPWAMLAVWAVYGLALLTIFSAYLSAVVPLVWDLYLDIGGNGFFEVLQAPRLGTAFLLMLGVLPAAAAGGMRTAGARPAVLGLAAIGALLAAMAQNKGFSYHIVPVEMFGFATGGVLAARLFDRARLPLPPARTAAVLIALMALYVISNGEAPWKQLEYKGSEVDTLLEHLRPEVASGQSILVLSPGIYPIFPALNTAGLRLSLPTMNTWLLQGAYEQCLPNGHRYREPAAMPPGEAHMWHTVTRDFTTAPPAAVLIDDDPGIPWCGAQFDYLDYFRRDPAFAAEFRHYRQARSWDRYRLFVREK